MKIKGLTFPKFVVPYRSRSGLTPFRVFRVVSASSKEGAEVDLVLFSFTSPQEPRSHERHMSYSKFQKMNDVNDINFKMKRTLISNVFQKF